MQQRQQAFRAQVLDSGVTTVKFARPEQLEMLLLQALHDLHETVGPAREHSGDLEDKKLASIMA